ncbi:MAG: bifunctional oligoribonuclease/PAP phosphatase NrnA [Bacteroidetes bacterium]|nr:bifunctional oligoribonuclease/PAP phosphatase NrnA [Bacteroidota bacterium]
MTQNNLQFIGIEECSRILHAATHIVLTTHMNPDGDAIGSECALYAAFTAAGKDVRIINCDAAPENLTFLNGSGQVEAYVPAMHDAIIAGADLLVALDFNDIRRVRQMEQVFRAGTGRKLVVDHHLDPKPFADFYFSLPGASSTAEIVYDILESANDTLSYDSALGLYTGIMTDTGSFRFDRTTPRVHRIAACLLEAGVDPVTTHRQIFDDYPIGRTQLLGMILAGIERHCDGRVSVLGVTTDMFVQTGTTVEDVENIVNMGLAIRGVEATALLTEFDGHIKVSFRSRGSITVNDIAGAFGGGGHRLAAGAMVEGVAFSELKERVAAALCAAVNPS